MGHAYVVGMFGGGTRLNTNHNVWVLSAIAILLFIILGKTFGYLPSFGMQHRIATGSGSQPHGTCGRRYFLLHLELKVQFYDGDVGFNQQRRGAYALCEPPAELLL